MGALGYTKNKLPFLELAHRLPLKKLETITQGGLAKEECLAWLQAWLLGAAGLLPSQRQEKQRESGLDGGWIEKLEGRWASRDYDTEVISGDAWHLFKVRPANSPVRRLVAMSYLLLRYQDQGILEGLISQIKENSASTGHRQLEEGLMVSAHDCWSGHLDFGSASGIGSPSLIGQGRAADIVVNVLLPFAFAWSQPSAQPELAKKALGLYRRYPRLPANAIERHMTQQIGLTKALVNSARRQQGLIHIYNTLCTQGRCRQCRLSQLEARHNI